MMSSFTPRLDMFSFASLGTECTKLSVFVKESRSKKCVKTSPQAVEDFLIGLGELLLMCSRKFLMRPLLQS